MWDTNSIVRPSLSMRSITTAHLRRNALSPTARTSSTSRIGSSIRVTIEKASRALMPLEKCITGVSTNRVTPAHRMISSKRASVSSRVNPCKEEIR